MPKPKVSVDPMLAELTAIKRLLVGLLMQAGASQDDVGKVLGINRSNVSRMFPKGSAKEITKIASQRGAEKETR
jgi:predicted transcriptional regulator